MIESLSIFRTTKYSWMSKKASPNNKKIVGASEIFQSDEEIAEKYNAHFFRGSPSISEELAVEVIRDTERLAGTINSILSNPKNCLPFHLFPYQIVLVRLLLLHQVTNIDRYLKE
jgi:hypothetical protein